MNPYSTITADQEASPTPPAPVPQRPALPAPPAVEAAKGSGSATATAPARPKTPPVSKPLDMYKVLLHNDDVNEMLAVVQAIVEVVPMPARQAFTVMAEAHKSGVALVTVTHLERAELFQEQFQSKGLTVTIEKA